MRFPKSDRKRDWNTNVKTPHHWHESCHIGRICKKTTAIVRSDVHLPMTLMWRHFSNVIQCKGLKGCLINDKLNNTQILNGVTAYSYDKGDGDLHQWQQSRTSRWRARQLQTFSFQRVSQSVPDGEKNPARIWAPAEQAGAFIGM